MSTSIATHDHAHAHEQPSPGTPEYDAQPLLLHQFADRGQQKLSSILAMWAFLATEVMFFGGLILAFIIYRALYHKDFVDAARHLSIAWGGFNTVVLLGSSLTMAMAVRASQLGERKQLVRYLIMTMGLGTIFLGVKGIEWTTDYKHHLVPGFNFHWEGPPGGAHHDSPAAAEVAAAPADPLETPGLVNPETEADYNKEYARADNGQRAQMFFVLYFFMTGLHGIHMIIGIGVVGVMCWLSWRGWMSGCGATQIEVTGLYWHFVDIVWVFLYPLLYLINIHYP